MYFPTFHIPFSLAFALLPISYISLEENCKRLLAHLIFMLLSSIFTGKNSLYFIRKMAGQPSRGAVMLLNISEALPTTWLSHRATSQPHCIHLVKVLKAAACRPVLLLLQ